MVTRGLIVPAILTDKAADLQAALSLCGRFARYVQIDIMDGQFVPSTSVDSSVIESSSSPVASEAHLMCVDPLSWIAPFKKFGAQRIIFHFEIDEDHLGVIKAIKKQGMEAGLAVNPGTRIEEFRFLMEEVDSVLFMSVNPGFYGAAFIPEVLDKIRALRALYPEKIIGIDGGVKLDNLKTVVSSGASYICVGSAIMKDNDPAQAYRQFVETFGK